MKSHHRWLCGRNIQLIAAGLILIGAFCAHQLWLDAAQIFAILSMITAVVGAVVAWLIRP